MKDNRPAGHAHSLTRQEISGDVYVSSEWVSHNFGLSFTVGYFRLVRSSAVVYHIYV